MVCCFFRFRDSQKTCHWQLFCVLRQRIPKISEFRFMGFSQTEVIQKSPFRVS